MGYIGGKASAGAFHRIIGQMPPHSVYVEPFFGGGAIFWNKRPSASTIVIDRVPGVLVKAGAVAGVRAICDDAISILPTLNLPADALVYADPPYVLSTRKNRRYYQFEMEDSDHVRLLDVLKALPCRVMISGYFSPLYADQLKGWRVVNFKVRTRGKTALEFLWCNFPEPVELHDWRYAGLTWRQTQSLKRLAARWTARLQGMPARKRGFLLDHLSAARVIPDADRSDRVGIDVERSASSVTALVTDQEDRSHVESLVLSLFPGADLFGRGFEQEGFSIVRGPDKLWGQDIRDFHPARGAFEGIIGGSPCQDFSKARRDAPDGQGVALLAEFGRVVLEAQPEWFLLENVPGVPDLIVTGYKVQRFNLNANECGGAQNRLRCFQFGTRNGAKLVPHRSQKTGAASQPCCMASDHGGRSFADFCALQGLPRDFVLPGWSKAAKYAAVGNGVPVYMARVLAAAVKRRHETKDARLCICDCGREVSSGRTLATAACRKRMERRRRDNFGVAKIIRVTATGDVLRLVTRRPVTLPRQSQLSLFAP